MALVAVYVRSASINIIRSYRMQMSMNLSDAGHLLSLLVLIADGRLCGVFFLLVSSLSTYGLHAWLVIEH